LNKDNIITEESGIAILNEDDFPGLIDNNNDKWIRYEHNPVISNGDNDSYDNKMASDPKVYYDNDLNCWIMI